MLLAMAITSSVSVYKEYELFQRLSRLASTEYPRWRASVTACNRIRAVSIHLNHLSEIFQCLLVSRPTGPVFLAIAIALNESELLQLGVHLDPLPRDDSIPFHIHLSPAGKAWLLSPLLYSSR